MLREDFLRKYTNKNSLGLEIGPLSRGICRKDNGYNALILDVYNVDQIIDKYKDNINEKDTFHLLEEVDIVSTKSFKEALIDYSNQENSKFNEAQNSINYVISSHNFEHFPNPIKFLRDISECLEEGGVLTMAIPIATRCFDCFQSLNNTGQMIDAYYSEKTRPSGGDVFNTRFRTASLKDKDGNPIGVNDATFNFEKLELSNEIILGDCDQLNKITKQKYVDTHLWRFNEYSFQLIFQELIESGLVKNLEIIDCFSCGCEFIVYIKKNSTAKKSASNNNRLDLLKKSLYAYSFDLFPEAHSKNIDNNINEFKEVERIDKKLYEDMGRLLEELKLQKIKNDDYNKICKEHQELMNENKELIEILNKNITTFNNINKGINLKNFFKNYMRNLKNIFKN